MSFSSEPRARSEPLRFGLVLALLASLLVILAAARLPLIPDEAYYWSWSRSLRAAYFDHPPAVAWVLRATRELFGESPFALRLPSLLAMAGALWLSMESARRLSPQLPVAPGLAALMLLASPMFLAGLIPATPDGLLAFGAALGAWALVRALDRGTALDWALAGFVLTLLVGLKHYGGLLSLGAGAALLLSAEARARLRLSWLGLGALAGLAALSPWLWAEFELGRSSSLVFQLQRVLHGRPRFAGPISVPVTLGSMLGTLGPISVVGLFWLGPRALRGGTSAERVLYAGAAALVGACFVAVWLGSGEANWPLPALVFAVPALASGFGQVRALRPLIAGLVAGQVLVLLYLAHMAAPFLPLPLHRDPAARGAGRAELAARVLEHAREVGAVAVGARTYQLASLLGYHLRDELPVYELGLDRASQYERGRAPSLCPGDRVVTLTPRARGALPAYLRALGPKVSLARGASPRRGQELFELSAAEVVGDERCLAGSAP